MTLLNFLEVNDSEVVYIKITKRRILRNLVVHTCITKYDNPYSKFVLNSSQYHKIRYRFSQPPCARPRMLMRLGMRSIREMHYG